MTLGYAIKRALDYGLAAGGLAACAPAMALIAVAIVLDSPGGAFYVQDRLGRGGRTFRLLKFRTMRDAPIRYHPDGSTRIDPGDDRVTRIGRHLRGAADELPQLINVLRGEMSLVGPRPPLPTEVARYAKDTVRRLRVRPGMTGLWQVSGRSDLAFDEAIRLDLYYVDNWSMLQDLTILVRTLGAVLGSKGAY
jgi:lipopolysaccharide/colanic/teichoic acid biosynthesis glycosyltransferase